MTDNIPHVKDFLYLDIDRLYSLYSQVFEGIVEQIVHSFENSLGHSDNQKGAFLSGSSIEAQVAEVSRRTESRFLYDDMYNRLESKLSSGIVDGNSVFKSNVRDLLVSAPLIKVSGKAEIEDYERLKVFIGKFNRIGEAIAYAQRSSGEMQSAIADAERQIETEKDRNKKAKMKEQLKSHSDVRKIAKAAGLQQDEKTLENLSLFIELFYPDGLDISISPSEGPDGCAFRAPITKRWLRVLPEMIRTLYGNYAEAHWTLVGQVTYIPGDHPPSSDDLTLDADVDENNPSMRDPFRNMFRTARVFDRMFLESKNRTEIVISPLAIYRVATIPNA